MTRTFEEELLLIKKAIKFYGNKPVRLARHINSDGITNTAIEYRYKSESFAVILYICDKLYKCLTEYDKYFVLVPTVNPKKHGNIEESNIIESKELRRILNSYSRKSIIDAILEEL